MSLNSRSLAFLRVIKEGYWIGPAPFGYKRIFEFTPREIQRGKGRNPIVVNEREALLIKEVFELYATGNYTAISLGEYIHQKHGQIWGKARVLEIIANKFYAGFMCWNGEWYPHNYPTLISEELFYKVQKIRDTKKSFSKSASTISPDKKRKRYDNTPIPNYKLKRLMDGLWLTTYPRGYKVIKNPQPNRFHSRGEVYVYERDSTIVKDIMTSYATGNYSVLSLSKYISSKYTDIKMSTHNVHTILTNKFYIGIMEYKGKEFPHVYPTFISKDLFDRVQFVLANNTKHSRAEYQPPDKQQITLTEQEQTIYDCLSVPLDIEDLSLQSNIAPSELKIMLSGMIDRNILKINEYKEYVRSEHGQR
jgi:hypothetical protein